VTPQEAAALIEAFLDGSCGAWAWDDFTSTPDIDPRVERARRRCLEIPNQYPPTVANQYCSAAGCAILRDLASELRGSSHAALPGANAIVADALEAEAKLQESGDVKRLGDAYTPTYARVVEIDSNYGEAIGFAFTFWDEWADAANHDWQFHDPVTESDWPKFAREIAVAVRQGRVPANQFLVDQIRVKPRRTFRQWFWSWFERAV